MSYCTAGIAGRVVLGAPCGNVDYFVFGTTDWGRLVSAVRRAGTSHDCFGHFRWRGSRHRTTTARRTSTMSRRHLMETLAKISAGKRLITETMGRIWIPSR